MHSYTKFLILFSALLFCSLSEANARPMITDMSERKIDIHAKFTGKELLLYGARVEAGDIVVAIRGPKGDYVVRKKEDIGGIWINTSSVKFSNVPQFYLLAASESFNNIDAETLRKKLEIGFDTLEFKAEPSAASTDINDFEKALVKKLEEDKLLTPEVVELPLLEGTLFRIRINFPEKIVSGIYTAEIYSFDDGELRGIQAIPINVKKVGLEAFIYEIAHEQPALYGLLAIIIAIGMGWLAGNIFKKV